MPEQTHPDKLQVFLCHSSGDKEEVRLLYQRLKAEAWVYPWLDEEELFPGQVWRDEIEIAVEQSHVILICLSPASLTKESFVQREIKVALDRADEMPEGTIYIIPLKLKPCENLPRRLSRLHWADYFEERGYENLLRGLRLRAEKLGINCNPTPVNPPTVAPVRLPDPPLVPPPPVQTYREEPVIAFVRTPKPVEKEQEKLLLELKDLSIGHERRRDIGDRLSKIGDTRRGVGLDKDGLPDIEWLPVTPGGQLTIEKQTFTVQPFYIARYPVTYVQYEAFVKAKDGFDNPEWWRDMPKEYQLQKLKEQYQKSWNHPRDNVSWYQSVAFTRWLNSRLRGWQFPDLVNANGAKLIVGQDAQVRLPTELEWQWAAQGGSQQRKYPWGEWKDGYANTDKANLNRTVAVGMYPQGTAVCGAEDMSGNVLEWCLNEYSNPKDVAIDNGTNVLVLRGGAFLSNAYYAASAVRYDNFANSDDFRFGCRVVFCPPYPSVSDL